MGENAEHNWVYSPGNVVFRGTVYMLVATPLHNFEYISLTHSALSLQY